jgi:hypothetical protein
MGIARTGNDTEHHCFFIYTGCVWPLFFSIVSLTQELAVALTLFIINIQEQEKPHHTSDKLSNLGEQKLLQYI